MWRTSAYHAASMSAVKTGETGATTNAALQAGAPRFMSMQIVEGDADFGADPMLAVIAEWSISKRLEPVEGAVKSRQGSPAFFS
jgi:hypothetical protein